MYSTKQVDNPETKISFPEMPSYKIIDHLYDAQKDFIILGLCGKTGSGVSTTASLLENEFNDLNLPVPGYGNSNLVENHEYRILYTFAKENWKNFYRIDVSSLITRNILLYRSNDFIKFTEQIIDKKYTKKEKGYINDFYQKSFPFNITKNDVTDYESLKNELSDLKLKYCISENKSALGIDGIVLTINNENLARLFDNYVEKRKEKNGFKNHIIYTILKDYIYNLLPNTTKILWANLSKDNKSLPTKALQCLGNNLRIFKKPFGDKKFSEDGYTYIAEEINSAIKLLSAFNYYKNSQEKIGAIPKKDKMRTMITVDSIKNPYESFYLKQRYNNYFLLGIYTEENERRERLREIKKWNDNEIDEVDSVEQISKLKKYIKNKLKNENQKHQKKTENEEKESDKSISLIDVFLKLSNGKITPKDFLCISPFISQNISKCLESADILINNYKDNSSFHILKKTLLRYVSLIMNPAIVLPTNVERCMQIAQTAKINSGCISRQVGAALTDSEYHLLSIGWNQQPENQLPCSYRDICEVYHHWSTMSYSDYENDDLDEFQKKIESQVQNIFDSKDSPFKTFGKIPCYCFKDYQNSIDKNSNQVHTRALHAEETAFLQLGPNNFRANNGFLFTTSSPCELCSKKARFLNIAKIYYIESYPGVSQKHVINIGEEKTRPELVLFTGAIGAAYTKLYTPLIARKDENEMLLGQKMSTKLGEKNEEKGKENKNEKTEGYSTDSKND